MSRLDELSSRLAAVRADIAQYEAAAGRPPGSVTLLPVTKFHPASDIELLASLGVTAVAENREQEARAKAAELPDVDFHMIGQIQTKKANAVARWASCVHSVDSIRLATALSHGVDLAIDRGQRPAGTLPCYIQLSIDGDTSRGGAVHTDLPAVADAISNEPNLDLAGIMCVPPRDMDPTAAFTEAAEVLAHLSSQVGRPLGFSAGMSGDMAAAIKCGSTVVRVGTAILGARPLA